MSMKVIKNIAVSFIDDDGDFRTYNFNTEDEILSFEINGLTGLECTNLNICHIILTLLDEELKTLDFCCF